MDQLIWYENVGPRFIVCHKNGEEWSQKDYYDYIKEKLETIEDEGLEYDQGYLDFDYYSYLTPALSKYGGVYLIDEQLHCLSLDSPDIEIVSMDYEVVNESQL